VTGPGNGAVLDLSPRRDRPLPRTHHAAYFTATGWPSGPGGAGQRCQVSVIRSRAGGPTVRRRPWFPAPPEGLPRTMPRFQTRPATSKALRKGRRMSATYRRPALRQATSASSGRAARRPGHAHADAAADPIARLDALAAHLRTRGWTTYIHTPAGRLASLFVQDPHHHAECGDILAAPDGTTGDWWYWFSWAERITPVHSPAAAADAIIAACQRPADGSLRPAGARA